MRWKDRRCVSQSCRFCDSCLCFFLLFPVLCIGHTLQQSFQQSYSAVLFGTTQQVNTIGKRLLLSVQYYTLGYLKYFMSVQIRNHHVPWIFSSEAILIITWRKMKVACPTLKYYAHLPDACNYVKNQVFYE